MSIETTKTSNIPPEIVYEILTYQFRDYMSNDQPSTSEKFNENLRNFLRSNLTVNKTFYHICRILVYRYCNFTTAKRFHSLLNSISYHDELRNIIQVADFQELTSIGLGRTNEMNKMIKNLTNDTLLQFLKLTKSNLREFLASEHIQDDLDDRIIFFLLKPGTVLSVLDFCGCSGPNFTNNFISALRRLYPSSADIGNMHENPLEYNYQITCLGLNDCTDLPSFVLHKTLRLLPELQKLDLSRTSIDDSALMNGLPHLKNLTHLSLANCSQLTPRAILEFFSHHPAVTDENNMSTLEWLNISVISHTSSWNEAHTTFLLKKLCQFGHNKTLQYLNIGGLPLHQATMPLLPSSTSSSAISLSSFNNAPNYNSPQSIFTTVTKNRFYYHCNDALIFIKINYPYLKSLTIRHNNIPIGKLVEFLTPLDDYTSLNLDILNYLKKQKQQELKFLNISNNSYVNKWTIQDPAILTCSKSLVALEISFDAWQQIERINNESEIVSVKYNLKTRKNDIYKWKCYIDTSYGRRYWIYKTDEYLNRDDINVDRGTVYDSQGNKIIKIIKQPDYLKFAQYKISLSCGLVTQSSFRRKHCYRDVKPQISQFLTRNGGIAFGNISRPIIRPRLPLGGWRLLPDDDRRDTAHSVYRRSSEEHEVGSALYWDRSIHDLQQLAGGENHQAPIPTIEEMASISPVFSPEQHISLPQEEEAEETDEEYLNNPDLQRRRSQLSLFRVHHRSRSTHRRRNINRSSSSLSIMPRHSASRPSLNRQGSSSMSVLPHNNKKKANDYYYQHPEEFVYDPNDPITSERYRIHFELVNEYRVFGCTERGMYRYYSLKM
ncbi:hypothetical protein KAFR_0A06310 [Kazachstania africana CBS 2517]|uniref:Uncharacterized protein n=1 Tax=Kazachstania africana (strain ATCC 22294 / BCRC 22015 / CBS 2517 / CECT 1963 / NBRC 1671 / NRRL Y-8276) TaxID=1071382 RepID=H2ANW6_KAZAF|nr:hypothetical protein KAFR_0A06310 [Kazachstania africana CBS 2517]CCF56066.1 hypothetical protein KAFR_0A06310 [Kazachstania africana CBS 2517]